MKSRYRGFLLGCVLSAILVATFLTVSARTGQAMVPVSYNNIAVTLDGRQLRLTDASGRAVEPFILQGTTYLPVRAVASALDLDVEWDQKTQTVILKSGAADNLEVQSVFTLDNISDQILQLEYRMYGQVCMDYATTQVLDTYYTQYLALWGHYDERNDTMPESTFSIQYAILDQFDTLTTLYDLCTSYFHNPSQSNYEKFMFYFTVTAYDAYLATQSRVEEYYNATFPLD